MEERSFYRCPVCGNLVGLIKNGGVNIICCGQPMVKLEPNTTEAAHEKHIPSIVRQNGKIVVTVGSVEHPMEEKHYIEWIALISGNMTTRISLKPGMKPTAEFPDVTNADVYAYCNIHGLWKNSI